MQKDNKDLLVERSYGKRNFRGGKRGRFYVFVSRKIGRVNPDRITVDGFDFLKVLDTVGNVAGKVVNTAGQVSNVVGQLKTTFQPPAPPIQQTYVPTVQQGSYANIPNVVGIGPLQIDKTYLLIGVVLLVGAFFIFKK